jgi:Domain of unknown function (DUF5103)
MKSILFSYCILFCSFLLAQDNTIENEQATPYHIKTANFTQNGNISIPFFKLGDRFQFEFDDLYANEADYYYTITQYNYDWTPTPLLKNEYLNGLDNQRIQDYKNSNGCLQLYSHYNIDFPNKFNQIIKTGNYILKVFDSEENLVFSRKFIIYEDQTTLGITIRRSRDLASVNNKHNMDFFIDFKDKILQNPIENVKVSLFQNGKFNNAIHNIKPQYTLGTQLIYRYNNETSFWAGNEYLNFDNKNIRAGSNTVQRITSGDLYNVFLYPNYERKNEIYTFFPDYNGNYVVNNLNTTDNDIEADYSWIYFTLKTNVDPLKQDIYVTGMFNNYALSDEYKMTYNSKTATYELAALLKQGFVNYNYTLTDKNKKIDEKNAIDGNFFQTENEYIALVYYKGPADRYHKIIGIGRNNSTEIKN